jgi:iron complex transport system ATP-binding protein
VSTPAVDLRDVEIHTGGRRILGPVTLRVGAGERWVLMGPNGGGKTTLLSVAGGRRQPSRGTASVLGRRLGAAPVRELHGRIGHTSHRLAEMLPDHVRVEDVVLSGKRATLVPWFETYDDADRLRALERLRAVGCQALAGRPLTTCSQGERQRVLLARALFAEPDLLLLDEPAAGLDLPARETLVGALETVVAGRPGSTIVMATHHLEEIPPSATHAALLRDGGLVTAGPVEEALTSKHLRACFDLEVEVGRRAGRWWAIARTL